MPEEVRLWLLGGFRAERDEEPIPESAWERPSARVLVKLLALQSSHRLHREEVMEALWPELVPESATQSLRNALSRARKALEPGAPRGEYRLLRQQGELLELNPGLVWVDVDEYVQLARRALAADSLDALEHAAAAYSGELLPEDRFEDWAAARREEVSTLHSRVATRVIDTLEAAGRYGEAITRAEELLRQEPTQEELHRRLMRLHLLTGSRHRALQQYQACRAALEAELGVEPDEETEALHQEILALGVTASPAASIIPLPAAIVRAGESPFVGRDTARELLWQSLVGAQRGSGDVVLISGEPGVGKTRLVAEIGARAAGSGVRVLWGAGYGAEGGLPYGPFIEALEGAISSMPRERRVSLGERYPEIAPIMPSLETAAAGRPAPSGDSARFFASMVRLLTELAEEHPLLLVLDDLHAVDAASLQLLDHLMRTVSRHPWLILGTFRMEDVEEASPFGRLWTAAMRQGRSRRVGLMRLSTSEAGELVEALLEGPVDEGLVRHVVERSLGNPLFVGELVRALREAGLIEPQDGRWVLLHQEEAAGVPHGVRDLIGQRIGRLEAETRRVLQVAAVAGGEVGFPILLDASELTEGALLDALDQALAVRLLVEGGDGYAFVHPLFREALYAALSGGRRVRLHGTLATVLEARMPEEVEALAYHHGMAGHEEQAVVYLERAGDRAERVYAHGVAEGRYREVIAWLEAHGRGLEAVRVRRKLAEVLMIVSRVEEVLDALRPALEPCREAGEMEQLAAVAGQMGTAYRGLGRLEQGIAFLEPLLGEVERLEPGEGPALFFIALAQLHRGLGNPQTSLGHALRAAEIARTAGNEVRLAHAEVIISLNMAILRETGADASEVAPQLNFSQWRSYMEHAAEIFTRLGDARGIRLTLTNLAVYALWAGELNRAQAHYEDLVDLSTRTGNPGEAVFSLASVGWVQSLRGDTERALATLARAAEIGRSFDRTWVSVYPSFHLAGALLRCGDWKGAAAAMDEAREHADATSDLSNRRNIAAYRAMAELEQGRPQAALRLLLEFIESDPTTDENAVEVVPELARAYAESGDTDHALALIEPMVARFDRRGDNKFLVEMLIVQGRVLLLRDEVEEAHAVLARARELAAPMPYPYIEVQSLYLRGTAPGVLPVEATLLLEEARDIARRIGAQAYLSRSESALAALRETPVDMQV